MRPGSIVMADGYALPVLVIRQDQVPGQWQVRLSPDKGSLVSIYPEAGLKPVNLELRVDDFLVSNFSVEVAGELRWWWLRRDKSWAGARDAAKHGSLCGSVTGQERVKALAYIRSVDDNLLAMEEACSQTRSSSS